MDTDSTKAFQRRQAVNASTVTVTLNGRTIVLPSAEPVFLLRAQDVCAAETVRAWARMAAGAGAAPEMVRDAMHKALDMEAWPKKKVPDAPAAESNRLVPRHDDDVLQTTDAQVWAEDFVKRFTGRTVSNVYSHGAVDVALMVGWFANAIERGRSAGVKEGLDRGRSEGEHVAMMQNANEDGALKRVSEALAVVEAEKAELIGELAELTKELKRVYDAVGRATRLEHELGKTQRDQMEMATRAASEIEALRQQAASLRPAAEAWSVMARLVDALVRQPSQGAGEDIAWMLRQKAMRLKDELAVSRPFDAAGDKPSDS